MRSRPRSSPPARCARWLRHFAGFIDSRGEPATIRLSVNQVGALVMTLPGLISKALQTRFGDQSLRDAYPSIPG